MELKQITVDNYKEISGKQVVCYEKSDAYLNELKDEFPSVHDNIILFVDDYKRNQTSVCIGDNVIDVKSCNELDYIRWDNKSLIITSDYYIEAFEKIQKVKTIVESVKTVYYYANKETREELWYREKYKNDELQDMIVFRSGPHASAYVEGLDFADNSRAIFEYMLANNYQNKYKLIWFVKNPEKFVAYESYKNVCFYSFDWQHSDDDEKKELYYEALFHARVLFFTDAYGFVRNCRSDQVRVQLWHGCGFKTRTNFVPCEKRYDLNTVISKKYAEIHEKIYGLRKDQVVVTGYPKADWLFQPIERNKLEQLDIPKGNKYIFWLPTFRTADDKLSQLNEYAITSQTGLPILYNTKDLFELNKELLELGIVLVIKLHPFQKKDKIQCENLSNIVLIDNLQLVARDIQINELLGWADALISDYSSAAIDYLILDRPIAFTLDDVEEYEANRGFVFDNIREWLPGKEIFNKDDFVKYVHEIGSDVDSEREKRGKIRSILHEFTDDNSSRRVLDYLGIMK